MKLLMVANQLQIVFIGAWFKYIKTGMGVEHRLGKLIVMEHNTIKKILIGLIFCIVLFALSFLLEEKSKTSNTHKEGADTQIVTEPPDAEN